MSVDTLLIKLVVGLGITLAVTVFIRRLLPRFTRRTSTDFDDYVLRALGDAVIPFGIVLTLLIAKSNLALPNDVERAYDVVLRIVGSVVLIRFVNRIGIRFLQGVARRSDSDLEQLFKNIQPLAQALVWIVGALVLFQSLGVQLAAIWALLSAGGIGVGLALKEPAQELFAYLMILLDKPFTVGQFINVGSTSATVEKIGVRSTHLRSLRGEAVVMNNSALTHATLLNFADMESRRMIYSLGVTYSTTVEQMKAIPAWVEQIIDAIPNASFSRCHFTEFGDSSLNLELVYYIDTRDYTTALNAQQAVNLGIMECFAREGIEFAFPSRTLYLDNDSLAGKLS
ncbi:MAG: Low conductance mechanosensitive channel YnaI [Synechococcus sp. CC9902]|nr:MAG: Low conductance mechanosensitive channel YnaI [Synechococcus sp. CC9902]